MWWLFLFPMVQAQDVQPPEFRECRPEFTVAEQTAEIYYDQENQNGLTFCEQTNGPQQIFARSIEPLIELYNWTLGPTQYTLENPQDGLATLLHDTSRTPHQLTQIATEDLLEFSHCAEQLCKTIVDMCAISSRTGRSAGFAFRSYCDETVDRLMAVQRAKIETLLTVNVSYLKSVQRATWAFQRVRQLTASWVTGPMADMLGDMRDFTTNTTGLIISPKG